MKTKSTRLFKFILLLAAPLLAAFLVWNLTRSGQPPECTIPTGDSGNIPSQPVATGEAAKPGWSVRDGVRYYLNPDGTPVTGWLEEYGQRFWLNASGAAVTGWQEIDGTRYYFRDNGAVLTGWAELDGSRYCFDADGLMISGWYMENGNSYYFHADGTMAVGPAEINGKACYFTPNGVQVLLVNPWNALPEGYEPDLVYVDGTNYLVDSSCYTSLLRMLEDCTAAGYAPLIVSSYRTNADQTFLYQRKVNYYLGLGYKQAAAEAEAATVVAVPGTSEHQLGLALDIVDANFISLTDAQADTATQQWLMAHCHEYGFILRYPEGTTPITGIIYEPWHYRYVGVEIATEIVRLGITLEEYLDAVVTE